MRVWMQIVIVAMLLTLADICEVRSRLAAAEPTKQVVRDCEYPASWWSPALKKSAREWEILPQEAGPGEVILSKRNELGLLSNFAATPFKFRGKQYASLEGFWQMMKYPEGPDDPRATFAGAQWAFTRQQVAQMTGFEAKEA